MMHDCEYFRTGERRGTYVVAECALCDREALIEASLAPYFAEVGGSSWMHCRELPEHDAEGMSA